MLQKAYLLAKIGADTAENERNFAENWQLPYGPMDARPARGGAGSPRLPWAARRELEAAVRRCRSAVEAASFLQILQI